MKVSASPYRPLPSEEEEAALPQCDILVRRAVRHHHSVLPRPQLDHLVPVNPRGPGGPGEMVKGRGGAEVVQTNARISAQSALYRQLVHRVLPYRRRRCRRGGAGDDLGHVVGGGGDVGGQPGGHEPGPAKVGVVLGGRLRARRENLRRRRTALAVPATTATKLFNYVGYSVQGWAK